jgi:hypothetical protein
MMKAGGQRSTPLFYISLSYKVLLRLPPSAERERIEREIAVTDETMDNLVFDLYQLSPAERMIIEAGKA